MGVSNVLLGNIMGRVKPYKYKKIARRRVLPEPTGALLYKEEKQADEPIGPVQGKTPDSIEEFRLARALERFGVQFEFQVPIHGGRSVRGGQVIDFVIYTPTPRPVQVEAEYWHRNKSENSFKLALIRKIYNTEPIIVQSFKLQTQEAADELVAREII